MARKSTYQIPYTQLNHLVEPRSFLSLLKSFFLAIFGIVLLLGCTYLIRPNVVTLVQPDVIKYTFRNEENPFEWKRYNKSILVSAGDCAGMGNVIFRLAFVYAMGRRFHRTPIMSYGKNIECKRKDKLELYSYFPNIIGPAFDEPEPESSKAINFGGGTWKSDDFSKLDIPDAVIRPTGLYLQSFLYFNEYRDEIRTMMKPSPGVVSFVDRYIKNVWPDLPKHKMCIHLRSFPSNHPTVSTNITFATESIRFVANYLRESENISDIGLIIFTEKNDWIKTVKEAIKNETDIEKHHSPRLLVRAQEWALAQQHCDSFIITTIGSTYSWWMAYLMKEEAQKRIFYKDEMFLPNHENKKTSFVANEFLPPNWNELDWVNGTLQLKPRSL
ncbi:unnamed protein product [Bursaphelenchus okinawaensis]|uniref:L-Fucosyltransferase n=1 Tax=Bursaphelenchus okinawaensis TaxID=465554 RepID=A0A811L5I2_9BILA|nr:unnamed protein product [Bursaphelenchus okinawaensis]CAG9118115.1 unnamed protein product [Bursaphelenchus okinawaensis]